MSRELLSREICERALRLIGAFPTSETGAEPEHMREALSWLDLILAQNAGVMRMFRLVPATVSLTLTSGKQRYVLADDLGSAMPTNGIQFPIEAWIEDSAGNRLSVDIVTRSTFENVNDLATTGIPRRIYMDRLGDVSVSTYPTLAATVTETYTLKLVVQTFAPDVSPSGVSGTQPSGSLVPEISQAWQRWAVYALAADLGSGPIIPISPQRVRDLRKEAENAMADLLDYENREHQSTPPICEPYG
jgi:hypothetical protein